MTVLDALDAAAVRRWCECGVLALAAERAVLDAENVYPVADGDTGTNLLLTMRSVADAVRGAGGDAPAGGEAAGDGRLPDVVRAMAHGALLGARGNSGAILSQLLRGLAEVLAGSDRAGGPELRAGLRRAADLARAAVQEPVEGTLLTVASAAADAAAAAPSESLADVAAAAATGAAAALARTPGQLAVLAEAGVVDAGGRGLCLLLDELVDVVGGRDGRRPGTPAEPAAPTTLPGPGRATAELPVPRDASGLGGREAGSPAYSYEVQYLLALPEGADEPAVLGPLRTRLASLGDSVVVVGGEGLFAVHVHVDDVGAAVEAGVEVGRPSQITVIRFADQGVPEQRPPAPAVPGRARPPAREGREVVVVVPGSGLAEVVRGTGARVVPAPAGRPPAVADLLAAVHAGGVREALLLPADADGEAPARAAAAAARAAGLAVTALPVRSVVQSLAALAVADPSRPLADDAVTMAAAAAATRWAEVAVAQVRAQTSAGVCEAGDVLGLVEGDVVLIGAGVAEVARGLLERLLLAGGELVTLVTGAGAPPGLGDHLADYLHALRSGLDVAVYDGGQPDRPLLVGVE